jgi:hypothetical protein
MPPMVSMIIGTLIQMPGPATTDSSHLGKLNSHNQENLYPPYNQKIKTWLKFTFNGGLNSLNINIS